MPTYSPWVYSDAHQRYYMYKYGDDGVIMETYWDNPHQVGTDQPQAPATQESSAHQPSYQYLAPSYSNTSYSATSLTDESIQYPGAQDWNSTKGSLDASKYTHQHSPSSAVENATLNETDTSELATFSQDLETNLGSHQPQVTTNYGYNNAEALDSGYQRVESYRHSQFFVKGRVFAILWAEPAGLSSPGTARESSSFTAIRYHEHPYSEIRRFVVIRNKGSFSQCVPIRTYRQRGATKHGLIMRDHGVIYTSATPPPLLPGENLDKQPIHVWPTNRDTLAPESRVNYGKVYAVEHNVKVRDIGMVDEEHLPLIDLYYEAYLDGLSES